MKVFQVVFLSALVALVASRAVEQDEGKRLIKTTEENPGEWMTEQEIFGLIREGKTFIDVTDFDYSNVVDNVNVDAIPTTLRFNATVRRVLNNLNSPRVQEFVRRFSSYHNRYYADLTGRQSQLWLLSQVAETISLYNGNATVEEVDHGYLQRSIVARLIGSNPAQRAETVIIGAHLDSVSRDVNNTAPGADDNASGSVVVLEVLRAIVDTGLLLNKTLEFHWYAAEEIGLRGSQAIARQYKDANVNVTGMLNLDVLGWYNGTDAVGVFTDNGNAELMQFLRILTGGYLDYGYLNRTCGYGCSDHASWTNNGFPAVMASELVPNPHMHTPEDSFEKVHFPQVNEFVKLSIGFAVELAEPKDG